MIQNLDNTYGNNTSKNHFNKRLVGKLEEITIKGFKSLKDVQLYLRDINVLVGINGVGKSNILGFFDMLGWMMRSRNLQEYISRKGGANDLLFHGSKTTREMSCKIKFRSETGLTEYQFTLRPAENDSLVFGQEEYRFTANEKKPQQWTSFGMGHKEVKVTDKSIQFKKEQILIRMLQNCTAYQFHDTSDNSSLRQSSYVDENVFLRSDGGNLASILYDLQQNLPSIYQEIVNTIRKVLPDFNDFKLQELYNKVKLIWTKKNNDVIFPPHLTSDGTLRFFALATLLSMPEDRVSDIILLDEPELGMHPHAIIIIAALIRRLTKQNKQVIVATQSPLLINQFTFDDIIVLEMKEDASKIKRLNEKDVEHWIDEYRMGDLWQKNVFGGNPD